MGRCRCILWRRNTYQIRELYVDSFFQKQGIGAKLIRFAIQEHDARCLWALEKNEEAVRFYQSHGFVMTGERRLEQGTTEFVVKMECQGTELLPENKGKE